MAIIDLKTGLDLEKVQLAEKIAESDDFSTAIVNASIDGIITYDLEVRYTLWSPQMEKMTGLKSEQVLGKCAFDLFPFLKEAGIDQLCERTFRGETGYSPVIPYVIPETGAQGFTQQQNFPLYDEFGKITGGMAIIRDVTGIKKKFDEMSGAIRTLESRVEELELLLQKRSTEFLDKNGLDQQRSNSCKPPV